MVTMSPTLSESLVNPSGLSTEAAPASISSRAVDPSGFFTCRTRYTCGFRNENSVTVPVALASFCVSNAAALWCAAIRAVNAGTIEAARRNAAILFMLPSGGGFSHRSTRRAPHALRPLELGYDRFDCLRVLRERRQAFVVKEKLWASQRKDVMEAPHPISRRRLFEMVGAAGALALVGPA